MVIKANAFTPEVMLSAPQFSPAVPNEKGTKAILTVSTYDFDDHKSTNEIRILDLATSRTAIFSNDENAHDAQWLGDGTNAVVWLQSGASGITSIMIGDADEPDKASYTADVILAPFSNLKLKRLENGEIACVMTGLATSEGKLYNEVTAEKSPSSARTYDSLYVRFWNRYIIPEKNTLWYSKLAKGEDGKYSLAAPVHNALKGTGFECPFDSGLGDPKTQFDISTSGLLFLAADPKENVIFGGSASLYLVPLSTFDEERAPMPRKVSTGKYVGAVSSPRFAPCGKKVAFLVSPTKYQIEARILIAPDITAVPAAVDFSEGLEVASGESWNRVPNGLKWGLDGRSLLVTADDCGRIVLFEIPLSPARSLHPRALTRHGSVAGYYSLDKKCKKLLVTSSSIVDSVRYSIVNCAEPDNSVVIYSPSKGGNRFGLSPDQVSEVYFEGDGDYCVQAFVVKPKNFCADEKYPLALIIHGGTVDATRDMWSTRWNPALWAEQGYVCVLPNISGSTGFGVEHTRRVFDSWGGHPYRDLIKCFEHVEENMPFVDTDNAIVAGASYGGYMANWIQGNPFGRKFKAIVSHDSIYNTEMLLASDDFSLDEDFGGSQMPWENAKNLKKYNPARPDLLANWKTPMLVIHSDLDYRCPVFHGLAAFGTCQALGTPSRYLNFPDEGHWVLKPENSLVWHQTVFDWVNKYSGITQRREEEREFMEELEDRMSHITV